MINQKLYDEFSKLDLECVKLVQKIHREYPERGGGLSAYLIQKLTNVSKELIDCMTTIKMRELK